MVTTFKVLFDPTRRRILYLLRDCERHARELDELLNTQSGVSISKHLRRLLESSLVRSTTTRSAARTGSVPNRSPKLMPSLRPIWRFWVD